MSHTSTGCLSFRKSIWTSHWDSYAFLETVSCSKLSCLLEMEDPSLMKSTCKIVKTTSFRFWSGDLFNNSCLPVGVLWLGTVFWPSILNNISSEMNRTALYTDYTVNTVYTVYVVFFVCTYVLRRLWITSFHRHSCTSGNWQSSSVLILI